MILRTKAARLFCFGLAFMLVFSTGLFSVIDFNLMDPWGTTWLDVHGTASAGLLDNPVSMSGTSFTVNEGDSVELTAVLGSSTLLGGSTVRYETIDGTAGSSDYNSANSVVYFGPRDSTASFTIRTKDDDQYEGDEYFYVSLIEPSTLCNINEPSRVQITILDNDPKPVTPTIKLSSSTFSADENSLQALITVEKTETGAASVGYAASAGTASASSDFTPVSGTLSFGASESSKTFTVPLINDDKAESSETVDIQLSNASGAELGSPSSAVLTITDSDSSSPGSTTPEICLSSSTYSAAENAGTKTITVNKSGTGAASVSYSATAGTAAAGQDFTATSGTLRFAEGVSSMNFTIDIIDDTKSESSETVNILLSSPSGATLTAPSSALLTITDNDSSSTTTPEIRLSNRTYSVAENEKTKIITVEKSGTSAASVSYAVTAGTATAGQDFTAASGTLKFAEGVTSTSFTIDIIDDTSKESSETVYIQLSSPSGATLSTPNSATLTITDNDSSSSPGGGGGGGGGIGTPTTTTPAAATTTKTEKNAASTGTEVTTVGKQFGTSLNIPEDILGHWGRECILAVMGHAGIYGYSDSTMRPNRPITRAEAAVLMVKVLNLDGNKPKIKVSPYKDALPSWAKDAILIAADKKLMGGYADHSFKPNKPITRAEICTILMKAYPSNQANGAGLNFADKKKIPGWASQWVAQAVGRSIVGGYPDKTFKASRKVTRAETFTMVCKSAGYHTPHAK